MIRHDYLLVVLSICVAISILGLVLVSYFAYRTSRVDRAIQDMLVDSPVDRGTDHG